MTITFRVHIIAWKTLNWPIHNNNCHCLQISSTQCFWSSFFMKAPSWSSVVITVSRTSHCISMYNWWWRMSHSQMLAIIRKWTSKTICVRFIKALLFPAWGSREAFIWQLIVNQTLINKFHAWHAVNARWHLQITRRCFSVPECLAVLKLI